MLRNCEKSCIAVMGPKIKFIQNCFLIIKLSTNILHLTNFYMHASNFKENIGFFVFWQFCIRSTWKSKTKFDTLRRIAHKSDNILDIDSKLCRIMRNIEKIKVMKFQYSKSNILGYRVKFIKRVANVTTLGMNRVKHSKATFLG